MTIESEARAASAGTAARRGSQSASNWRAARFLESRLTQDFRRQHWLWLHGACIGSVTFCLMAAASALQKTWGQDSLALRYLISLGLGYGCYLGIVRLWAGWIARKDAPDLSGLDLPNPSASNSINGNATPSINTAPSIESGGGGDFGGGGASGEWVGSADVGDGVADLASGALDVAGAADEGVVVVVPVLAIFLAGLALLLASGSMLLLFFGWDVLLAVAVELAFSYASARTLFLVEREGWFSAAMRLTWKPLLGTALSAVVLGATIDYFMPQAHSLPEAIQLLRGSAR